MPQITVDYSENVADAFDRRAFGPELHALTAEVLGGPVDACKTRFARIDEGLIGDGSPSHAMIHVELAILSGRDQRTRSELGEAVLRLVRDHVAARPALAIQITVEIRELDRDTYHKHVTVAD